MPNFISEDDIEQAMLQKLQHTYGYDVLNCYTEDREDLNDDSGRSNKSEVILPGRLREALVMLNPGIPDSAIDEAVKQLCDQRGAQSLIDANREIDGLIRDGVRVEFKDGKGKTKRERIKVIDFQTPSNNEFLAVSQLWILGEERFRRPDILLYINGLPLVFIELKNSNVKLQTAYDKNLVDYKNDIPQLFLTNAFCVFSNANETRIGSMTAEWEHFFHWLRPDDEKEKIRRQQIEAQQTSVERFMTGLCPKANLLDYVENFVLYYKRSQKIIAQNHQFIGVNRGFEKFLRREEFDGKLGVFWHTQGSGKSFSMIFYARKILRKLEGNYSFVVITDREDLDGQIYRNFLHTDTVGAADAAQPKNSEQLRKFLGENKRLVFTLIHKFRYPKGKQYPLLSERDDIVVIVDEAHRTQYKSLAENLRSGLPNAQYLAFTGTPLLGRDRKTKEWFGDYVSEYNFSQSMDDGATVPLFYTKRVPEMENQNTELSDEFCEILEDENLDDAQREKLENKYATEFQVIKRDDRLETIAEDIVYHFPRRGYLGKGMMITIDKVTAVKMHDKVQRLWKEEIKGLLKKIKKTVSEAEKIKLKQIVAYMRKVEMAVVISEEAGEEELFQKEGLDIKPHRKRIDGLDRHGHDIEHNFKDPEHPLQLVFVCSMWLTGFDAPTVSTLFLDKPQQNHTLMQTIARANRVTSWKVNKVEKKVGEIVDYYGVFRKLKKALKDYGQGTEGTTDPPVQDKEKLFEILENAIEEGKQFCRTKSVHIEDVLKLDDAFKKAGLFKDWADKLLHKDDWRKTFNVHENTISALYQASKPEILGDPIVRVVSAFQYLRGVLDAVIEQQDIESAARRIDALLDESVVVDESSQISESESATGFKIQQKGKEWDLSLIDFDKLKQDFKQASHQNIEIADLRAFIEKKLAEMLNQNRTRRGFAERLEAIINGYNAGSNSVDQTYVDLVNFAKTQKKEMERHIRKGLTEDELEIYDLLKKDNLSQKAEKKVRLAAKSLLKRLTDTSPKILVQDWYKNQRTKLAVRDTVGEILDQHLPKSYDRAEFTQKRDGVFDLVVDLAANHRKWAA